MAFNYINWTTYSFSTNNLNVAIPSGTEDWDILFVVINAWYSVTWAPAWWTFLLTGSWAGTAKKLYYRIAASEPASYNWAQWGSWIFNISCVSYRGWFNIDDPIDSVSSILYQTSNTSVVASWTVTDTSSPLIFIWVVYNPAVQTFTKPTELWNNWTEDLDWGSGVWDTSMVFCSTKWSGSWATWNITAIASSAVQDKYTYLIALTPAKQNANFSMFL